jgi:ribose transport system ATP-binding protein
VWPTLLRVEGVSKNFIGTRALHDVSFDIRSGEVHALVGQNGSGKSTLIKILSGYHDPDTGARFWLGDESVAHADLTSPAALRPSMSFVHQDLGLVSELCVADNFALRGGYVRSRFGRLRWRRQVEQAARLIAPFDRDIDVTKPVGELMPVERTIVSIAAALQNAGHASGVLVLDEPTAVLPHGEVRHLFAIVNRLRESGAGILYVSHRLDEVFALADRVTVLRNGEQVATRDVADLDKRELVRLILGSDLAPQHRPQLASAPAAAVLEVEGLAARFLAGATFEVAQGEAVGIAGFPDDGRDELPRVLVDQPQLAERGRIRIGGDGGAWTEVSRWRAPDMALVPSDRGKEGVVAPMTIAENLSLSALDALGTPFRLSGRRERELVEEWMARLDVRGGAPSTVIAALSGGNQQKVLIGRTLTRGPKVVVLCEPTAGVDIGARHLIYQFVAGQLENGMSAIVVSSDIGDLVAMCSRVLVLRHGVVHAELRGEQITENAIVHAIEQ